MRELKRNCIPIRVSAFGRTPPGVRELKLVCGLGAVLTAMRRTPPGVRELKLMLDAILRCLTIGRTPPGVRELKPEASD